MQRYFVSERNSIRWIYFHEKTNLLTYFNLLSYNSIRRYLKYAENYIMIISITVRTKWPIGYS
jgi:hypothetical protein